MPILTGNLFPIINRQIEFFIDIGMTLKYNFNSPIFLHGLGFPIIPRYLNNL